MVPSLYTSFRQFVAVVFLSFLAMACSSDKTSISFDSETWKSDLNGCQGKRLKLQEKIEEIRLQFIGMHERDVRPYLGKPDAEELLERSNKIYLYYLSPGPKCKSVSSGGETIALAIRFDALGTVRESLLLTE